MNYEMNKVGFEQAKLQISQFEYALIYYFSSVVLEKIVNIAEIDWMECLEARFFSEEGELHIWRGDDGFEAVEIRDIPKENDGDIIHQNKYGSGEEIKILERRFQMFGKYLIVKEYYSYDEDGQICVEMTRLKGIRG